MPNICDIARWSRMIFHKDEGNEKPRNKMNILCWSLSP